MRLPALGALLSACGTTPEPPAPPIAITHVTLIDGRGGPPQPDVTVMIVGRRITAVGPSADVSVTAGARVVEGRGRYLIPGLWDMHVHGFGHSFPAFVAPLLIANGVTGARDMGYYVDTAAHWRGEVAAGRLVGPRLVISGRIDGPANRTPFVARAVSAADGTRATDTLVRRGADFVKVYSRLPRAAYFAVITAARRLAIPVAGHVPYDVSVTEASDAGQRSIEHEDDLMRACSSQDDALRAALQDSAALAHRREIDVMREHAATMRASADPRRCSALFDVLARNGTRVVPTLVVYQPYARGFDSAGTHPERLRHVPPTVLAEWRRRGPVATFAASDTAVVTAFFSLPATKAMWRAGVRLMVGTDTPLPYVYPGFSVHDELALLVRAGLTPMAALQAATREPAAFLGALDSLGTVEPGRLADLVLLDADPLADIRNTQRIRTVVANGRLLDRSVLDELLSRAAAGTTGRRSGSAVAPARRQR